MRIVHPLVALALAVAYMHVVAPLAWMMFRPPEEPVWPTLFAHAKMAIATLSIVLFVLRAPHLVYAASTAVDGIIGAGALLLRRRAICWRGAKTAEADHERSAVPA